MTVRIDKWNEHLNEDNNKVCNIQLLSSKNAKRIPIRYETAGIKKIISILSLLILVYNRQDVTVVIDELDSGIFEYLLGEILSILQAHRKGQLIFTAHNLRPLETLDKQYLFFTTSNPKNRFIRMVNVKANNNFREFYYREIQLGGQKEEVYSSTSRIKIMQGFSRAGVWNLNN